MPLSEGAAPLVKLKEVGLRLQSLLILQGITFTIEPRQILTVIGPNGAGKTSLIRLILGLVDPSWGQIERAKGLRVGYVPQFFRPDPAIPLTVGRFLTLTSISPGIAVDEILGLLSVQTLQRRMLTDLSGGEMQRVLLARALLKQPTLLVLDEPMRGIDIPGQYELYALIPQLRDRYGCAIIIVSHDLHLVMAGSDHVLCINQHICCAGKPEAVAEDPSYRALLGPGAPVAPYIHHHDHVHEAITSHPLPHNEGVRPKE